MLVRWAARYLAARSLRLSQTRTAPPRSRCSRSAYAAAPAAARAAPAPLCQRRHSSYARLWAAGARPTVRHMRSRHDAKLMALTVSGAAIPRLQQKATAPLLPAEGYEGILGGTLTRRRTPSPVARWDRLLPPVRWDLPSCQPGSPPPPSSTSQVGVSQHQRSGSRWRSPRMPRRPSPWQRAERQRATSTQ